MYHTPQEKVFSKRGSVALPAAVKVSSAKSFVELRGLSTFSRFGPSWQFVCAGTFKLSCAKFKFL